MFKKGGGVQTKEYCLIGLNKFNLEVGKKLVKEGHKVTVLDVDGKKVNDYGERFDNAIICDATNLKDLAALGMDSFDYVVVGITDVGVSVIACTNLKELGVSNILCKAKNETHKRILRFLGVSISYIPEEEIANKVAYKLIHDLNVDTFAISESSKDIVLVQLTLTNKGLLGKKIEELGFLKSVEAIIISVTRKDGSVIVPVGGTCELQEGDVVYLIHNNKHIGRIKNFFAGD